MKKLIAVALFTAMLASLASCGNSGKTDNEEYLYGQIDSVSGNDIVLLVVDYNENASEDTDSSEKGKSEDAEDSETGESRNSRRFDKGDMPEGFDPESFKGEKPEGFSKPEDGEMPEGFDPEKFSGEMPEGFDPESFKGEKPEGFSRSGSSEKSGSSDRSKRSQKDSKYTLTGEQEELRIPVGTTVTTSLGVKTDFDALSEGDIIKCSVKKNNDGEDVVTEVWIMEQ